MKLLQKVRAFAPSGCSTPTPGKDHATCMSQVRTTPELQVVSDADSPPPTALTPADIQAAYRLPATGQGQTVAVVVAHGYTAAEADLNVFRSQYGLEPCTTENGCFRKVDQRGGNDYPHEDGGWSTETALNLDAVSSACPACHIVLVQADDASVDNLGSAVRTAVRLGAKFVSNPYALPDHDPSQETRAAYDQPGVVITAPSGNQGNKVTWPSSAPHVLAVGGTRLTRAPGTARGWTESAYDSGSACAESAKRPGYQMGMVTHCQGRATSDLSAVADPGSGIAVYNSSLNKGWVQMGGTSLASSLVTAMYALAGTPAKGSHPVAAPYAHERDLLFDVTEGHNHLCAEPSCEVGPGWDGTTGLGTPNGVAALSVGPAGTIKGRVTDKQSGKPLAGMVITAVNKAGRLTYKEEADASGAFEMVVGAGAYEVSTTSYTYGTPSKLVVVAAEETADGDLPIAKTPMRKVTGKVTDGSGQGRPLYAKITIKDYPYGPVFTDRKTGVYTVNLPERADYTMHVAPVYPGYTPTDVAVKLGSSDVRRDVPMAADLRQCNAPGYSHTAFADFAGWKAGQPQLGWSVGTKDPSTRGWQFNEPSWNLIGDGGYASVMPAANGGKPDETDLISPPFDLTGEKSADLRFNVLNVLSAESHADASVTTDGGKSWTQLWSTSEIYFGPVEVPLTAALGHRNVQVRFHFKGAGDSYFQVAAVSIGHCRQLPGGLVHGIVRDANTGQPVNGATVAHTPAGATERWTSAVTTTVPEDPSLQGGGFYWLYSSQPGRNTVTSTAPRYAKSVQTVDVRHAVQTVDPVLRAGRLKVSSDSVSMKTALHGRTGKDITLTNTGGAPLRISVEENSRPSVAPAPSVTAGPEWEKTPDYPEPIKFNIVGSHQGRTYSVGGVDSSLQGRMTKRGYVFDPASGDWSPIADLPQPRSDAAGAFVNGTFYVAGGWGYGAREEDGGAAMSTTYAYRPQSNTWSRVADLPEAMAAGTAAVLDGKLYVVGGVKADLKQSATVYRYEPGADAWSRVADYPVTVHLTGCGGIGGSVVCAGGVQTSGDFTLLAATYRYRPGTNTWTRAADMPNPTFGASYGSAHGRLQVVGGTAEKPGAVTAQTNRAVQYDPVGDTWSALPDAPLSVFAAGRGTGCGLILIGGQDVDSERGRTGASRLSGFDQCSGDDVGWLSVNRTTLTLAPGRSARLHVAADARGFTAPGTHAATLALLVDAPYLYAPLPVTLKATVPPSWAETAGTVNDAATGKPLVGATVTVSRAGTSPYTVTTDGEGRYHVWRNASTVTVTAAHPGYGAHRQKVTLKRGTLTTVSFALSRR
ncbi:carboxypeptidase regulatory-like domain-containing protein [Streptomyces sp. NPDC059949]|uniref:carboxypeptidase regulatory-like domain-containing protein n=1 Tax=Streptomyces sp. NPDC059949 TaxID=3347013 RepID=UPI003649B863